MTSPPRRGARPAFGTALLAAALSAPLSGFGHGSGAIAAPAGNAHPAFDVVSAAVRTEAGTNWLVFEMQVKGRAGSKTPKRNGRFPGAEVFAYVWPTRIDPAEVGFEKGAGLLALAVTVHPDFNDTPLFGNRGGEWHTHWVVLGEDAACGPGKLKVKDIPEGSRPRLPKTWPGVPLLIDSPGYTPYFKGNSVTVKVPFDTIENVRQAAFDGVTTGLRVNANLHQPLLCVSDVFDVASGDLSLPGVVR